MILDKDESLEEFDFGLKIIQNKNLYRFTSDAILLAKFASYRHNEIAADFCAGCGVVGLYAYGLNPHMEVVLFEMQKGLYDLSVKNIALNGLTGRIKAENCRLQEIKGYNGHFDLILCNPPYLKVDDGENKENREIAVCKKELEITLEEIIKITAKKLKNKGRFFLCHRTERLADAVCLMRENRLEPKRIQFVYSKEDCPPYLFLVEGVLNARPGLKAERHIINS